MFDHFSKYIKLYPISKATTKTTVKLILEKYLIEIGKPEAVITGHGTQFKAKLWKQEMNVRGIKTYKISVYHPSSNPAEHVLREVGRILRTYCYDNHKNWSNIVQEAETIINITHHDTIGKTLYQLMFNKPPPREITTMIVFPENKAEGIDINRLYNRIQHKAELRRKRQLKTGWIPIKYNVGEKVLIKNRQPPSSS